MSAGHHDAEAAQRVRDLEGQFVAAGVFEGEEVDAALELYMREKGKVANGARLVARAWLDDEFRELLLTDANEACRKLGLTWVGEEPIFRVVANTPNTHNVIVCTLCSCYPTGLLGPSPYWYRSLEYRARVVRDPKSVLSEFGFDVDDAATVHVWDASADARYMVLPERPPGTDDLDEIELIELITVRGLIGTAAV